MGKVMEPGDIGALVVPSDPRLSPDGSTVAFTVTSVDVEANAYRSRVWLAAADGSSGPRPFSRGGDARDAVPRWSPDGRRLALVSHREGEGCQVVILPVGGGGEPIVAARWPQEIEDLAWAPDGSRLALLARVGDPDTYGPGVTGDRDRPPRRVTRFVNRLDNVGWTMDRPKRVLVVDADGTSAPQEAAGPGASGADANGVAWSPDGKRLAWCQPMAEDWDVALTQPLLVVPAPGGEEKPVVWGAGQSLSRPSFSPDGRMVAAVSADPADPPRNGQIVVFDLEGREDRGAVLTTEIDRNCAPSLIGARGPVWDDTAVWFQVEDRGPVHLYRAQPGLVERMVEGDLVVTGFDVAGGAVAFTASRSTAPADLYILDRLTGAHRRLTDFGHAFGQHIALHQPEHFTVSTADGEEVDAWYLAPTGPDRHATLLNIHGGPFSQYTVAFFDEFAIQAGAGFGVLWCNPRGSSGRAEAWGRAIRGPRCAEDPGSGWGGVDADDVLAVADAAIERFGLDPARMGVIGGSYGGYLTSWLIGHTDRFAAACSERSVNNQLTMVSTSDIGTSFQRAYVGVSHLDEPEEYLRMSPITFVRAMTTPLLILHSDSDLRCPVSQAEELWTALRLLDRDVEFVRFPGAAHELSRSGPPKQRIWRAEVILDWFARRLGSSPDS